MIEITRPFTRRGLPLAAALAVWSFTGGDYLRAAPARTNSPAPLHERIDALIESEFAGPLAPPAGDADFLRRVYLDLVGTIPTADESRAFLADESPGQRARLVDRLLVSRPHARHLATFLDVMLMERRPEKHVKIADWQQFLFAATLRNQPYHELVRDILASDGNEEVSRAAARFTLDREADPGALTRDTGRILFGMDLTCAQCHDHPRIEDYLQRDYHGLLAFFNRTYLFTHERTKKATVAEKAAGDVTFASVFTKETGATRPRLPGGAQLPEPAFPRGEEYLVAPDPKDKNLRPSPKYSRRAELARLLPQSNNRAFNRNIVNRLWGMLMGRPLVTPVDEISAGNPAAFHSLLDLLAGEFAATGYDLRAFLRQLALTRVYQRSFELPAEVRSPRGVAVGWVAVLETRQQQLTNDVAQAAAVMKAIQDRIAAQRKAMQPVADELAKTNAVIAEVRKASDPASNAHLEALRALERKRAGVRELAEAQEKLETALDRLPGDAELTGSRDKLKSRLAALNKEIEAAAKDVATKDAAARPAREKLTAAEATAGNVRQRLAVEDQKVLALDAELIAARARWEDALAAVRHGDRRLDAARALARSEELRTVVSQTEEQINRLRRQGTSARGENPAARAQSGALESRLTGERAKAKEAGAKLPDLLEKSFAIGAFSPLTPEQLAWSMMRAAGVVGAQEAAARTEFEKQDPVAVKVGVDPARVFRQAEFTEQFVWDKLKSGAASFAAFFSAGAGEPQDIFFATADQALFLNNGGMIRSWLSPAGDNLTARLGKLTEPRALAEELYLSVLTRRPTTLELAAVTRQLAAREKERPAVVQELAWGLLTSAEFRFKH